MAKRQTDTKIWTTQRWFKKLHPFHKLVWKYLTDMCDHAGIWKIDFGQLVEDTGIDDFELKSFLGSCNKDFDKQNGEQISKERVKLVDKKIIWLTGFIRFQYENKDFKINPKVPAIKSALTILKGYGILEEALNKGYITLSEPFERTIDIDRDIIQGDGIGDSKRGTGEKKEGREGWNQMPGPEAQSLELPEMKAGAVHQLLMLQGSKEATKDDVLKLWGIFKIQNLNGSKFYNSENDVFSHFINWSKTQKINGTHQQQTARSNPKTAGVSKLLGSLKEDLDAGRAGNTTS